MATKIKNYKKDEKGIIIFTHKELKLFSSLHPVKNIFWKILKKYFFIGVHWGSFHKDVVPSKQIDFHLAGKGTLIFSSHLDFVPERTELCSRNFLSLLPSLQNSSKEWDVLNISRPIFCKRLKEFMLSIKELYKKGTMLKVLLVCSTPADYPDAVDPKNFYVNLLQDYEGMFTSDEKAFFKIELRADSKYPFSFSREEILKFYSESKVFALFSDFEGESRVISEALMMGLPVVAWKGLVGGGLDYLNSNNSALFDSYHTASEAFLPAVQKSQNAKISSEAKENFYYENSLKKFEKFLEDLYIKKGMTFTGLDLRESLDRALPSHLKILESDISSKITDDINSLSSLLKFTKRHTDLYDKEVLLRVISIFLT